MAVVRHLRDKFRKGKKELPKGLDFLESVNFYAIAEHSPAGKKKQRRVEFLPKSIKSIVSKAIEHDRIANELTKLQHRIEELQKTYDSTVSQYNDMKSNYDQLVENIQDGVASLDKSSANYINIAEKMGFISHGRPLQGGLPSLGKKR